MTADRQRLGLFAWFGIPVPFRERLAMIKDSGFGATGLWWEEDDEPRRKLRHLAPELVRKTGLYLDNIHVPYTGCNDLWSNDDDARTAMVRRHVGWVEDCARHEVETMVMHVSVGAGNALHLDHGLDSMRRIVDAAEKDGVTIAIENTRVMGHVDWLLQHIDSPCLGLCYDASHDWLYNEKPTQLLLRWGARLHATHFSDTDGRRDYHWLPGEGIVDFDRIAASHPWETYRGTLMLEVAPKDRNELAEAFLARAFDSASETGRRLDGQRR